MGFPAGASCLDRIVCPVVPQFCRCIGVLDISRENAMSRFRLTVGAVSVISIGCLVAALVQAQDATRFWSAAKGVRSDAPTHRSQLTDQYRSAGQAVAASYAADDANRPSGSDRQSPVALTAHQNPGAMLVADAGPPSGGLRSVLKRNSADSSVPAETSDASPPSVQPLTAPAAETPPAPSPPASIATESPPAVSVRPPAMTDSDVEPTRMIRRSNACRPGERNVRMSRRPIPPM